MKHLSMTEYAVTAQCVALREKNEALLAQIASLREALEEWRAGAAAMGWSTAKADAALKQATP